MNYESFQMGNGIRLVHRRIKSPVAHFGLTINTGSRDETLEELGVAHFIEHTIFKGTTKRKAYHILNRLDSVGADMNAFTTKEEICLYASFLKEHFGRTVELFADITMNSTFPQKEIEKEKDVVLDEINSYLDNPSEAIFDQIEDLVFEGHPLGRNILGTKESVAKLSRNKIFRFVKQNFHTDQMVITSVGDFPMSAVLREAQKYFDVIPSYFRDSERDKPGIYKAKTIETNLAQHQGHCMIANRAYGISDERRVALFLLNNILGGPGLNSRLNLGIREKYGFCYNLESNYSIFSDTGMLSIYLGTDFPYIDKTIQLVLKELKKLRVNSLGTMQLHMAKEQIKGQIAISNDSMVNELIGMGKSVISYDKVEDLKTIYNKIDAIQAKDLLEVANEIFDPNELTYLIYRRG